MSMMGNLHCVSNERLKALLAAPDLIQQEISEHEASVCSVEKAWDAIEFILEQLAEVGGRSWIRPLVAGAESGAGLHYGPICYRTPEEVAKIARTLSGISKQEFRRGFLPERMTKDSVYPDIWDRSDQDGNFDYVWSWYEPMVRYYTEAAHRGGAMLLWLS